MTTAQPATVSAHPGRGVIRLMSAGATRALWRRWVAANAVAEFVGLGLTGALAGLAIVLLEPRSRVAATVAVIASGAVEGAVVGYAQWRVLRVLGGPQAVALRHHVPRAWRWVLANALAWACALPLTFLAPSLVPADARPVTFGLSFAIGALVAGTVAAAVHGVALVNLLGGRGVELINPLLHRLLGGRSGPLFGTLALLRSNGRTRRAVGHVVTDGAELDAALTAYRARYPRSAITADVVKAGAAAVVLVDVGDTDVDERPADRGRAAAGSGVSPL